MWTRAPTGLRQSTIFLFFFPFIVLIINLVWIFSLHVLPWFSPTFLRVWKKGKRRYLFQLLVGWESEVTELLLWFYEGFFILPLDESLLSDQDWAGAWRCSAGKYIQSILGCLPWGGQHKVTGRALTAKPRQCFGLGGLVGNSPLQPNRNLLCGHSHEHDGPILTLLIVLFHSLPVRECEMSFLWCWRKVRDMLVLCLRKAETQYWHISFKWDSSYCYRSSIGPKWTHFQAGSLGGEGAEIQGPCWPSYGHWCQAASTLRKGHP